MPRSRPVVLAACLALLGLLLITACAAPPRDDTPPEAEAAAKEAETPSLATGELCPEPDCDGGSNCASYPYQPMDCWPTSYGPAAADVVTVTAAAVAAAEASGSPATSTNMLYCAEATYALCFNSGPVEPTGEHPESNPSLPCRLSADGSVAECRCQVFSGPSYVAINSILNLGAYNETVATCGADGSLCQNMTACGPAGDGECTGEVPPVCRYVAMQSPDDPENSLIPDAELLSTFSFAMEPRYEVGSSGPCDAAYAGCMTAPCSFEDSEDPSGDRFATCSCPTYTGPYQVGQDDQSCSAGDGHVWSASYTVVVAGEDGDAR